MDLSKSCPPDAPFQWNQWNSAPLNLGATLASGQNFRWRKSAAGVWFGTIENCAAVLWQIENSPDSPLHWQTFPEPNRGDILQDYLRLDVDLELLYESWKERGPEIAEATLAFRGLRILRQPPTECFFAFQCATCNTVTKIERSIAKLAARYGEPIDLTPQPSPPIANALPIPIANALPIPIANALPIPSSLNGSDSALDARCALLGKGMGSAAAIGHGELSYAFPTLTALAGADEAELRADLWGYRAPRVINLARELLRRPDGWLNNLRNVPYAQAKAELTALHGIGAKLADCICLFSLDKDEAVPIDTHVRQIATRLFLPDLCGKSLTPRIYDALADSYRERFGLFAGWAQQYLFFNELRRSKGYKQNKED